MYAFLPGRNVLHSLQIFRFTWLATVQFILYSIYDMFDIIITLQGHL